ncbi:autotransporter [Haemophilus influenzae biotype aegyptius]|uniref:autotransporter outer membrane beta-barrel domain-containing protein n=1 Tax=Haemophilus influenzae TaxID=727 RepID=UPI00059AF695|nr:autotransporter outer membrane beta-barrel domain-containing protein [Haemophilus influenzae]QEQ62181.1 autotransporter outer membrane beta-barrel domain-containing protein [Haemophilus influenzae biotype aegyptius]QEQ64106.1 autotransporter outer membrane beta-barrel domain-containing protein [Haemophilus influenzae biotype aegyptius]QEQ65745.1 autotransporter outer membrane beta-barrel domain-containing protein [Haemophilus influenzae biotype aegyptius]TMQ37092.1 autotransporter [Haemophil
MLASTFLFISNTSFAAAGDVPAYITQYLTHEKKEQTGDYWHYYYTYSLKSMQNPDSIVWKPVPQKIIDGLIKGWKACQNSNDSDDCFLIGAPIPVLPAGIGLVGEDDFSDGDVIQPEKENGTWDAPNAKHFILPFQEKRNVTSNGKDVPRTLFQSYLYSPIHKKRPKNALIDGKVYDVDVLAIDNYRFKFPNEPLRTLTLTVQNRSEVRGATLQLWKMKLQDSLWEPRFNSDVHHLETQNANIRFNSTNTRLTVHENYQGDGSRFFIKFNPKEATQPVLTFDKDVTGTSNIIFETPIEDLKSLDGHQIIKVNGTADKRAFRLSGKHQKGIYNLFLKQCQGGFCTGIQERNDIAIYAQQAQAANTLFALRLNDKNSDIFDRTLPRKGLWLRLISGHLSQDVQGKTAPVEGNRKGIQLGGDVFSLQNQDYQLSFGLMGGQAEQRSTFRNPDTDNLTTGNMKGFGAGIYATWHQLQDKQTGAYVDSWMQYQRFRHNVNSEDGTERFTSKGITASIEAGYNALLAEHVTRKGTQIRFYLQPQAQLTYLGVNGGLTDSGDSKVNLLGSRQLQSRVGIQAKAQFLLNKNIVIQPFVAVNALYHSKPFGVEMDGERRVINNKVAIESQLGVALKIKSHLTLQATFNRQTGKHHHAKQGVLNLQWTF